MIHLNEKVHLSHNQVQTEYAAFSQLILGESYRMDWNMVLKRVTALLLVTEGIIKLIKLLKLRPINKQILQKLQKKLIVIMKINK